VKYRSTRGGDTGRSFDDVLLAGLASDGGLYVPEELPSLPLGWERWGFQEAMTSTLELFGVADAAEIVASAGARFPADPAPVVEVADRKVYELFWGPTLSFKDHALQILARLLDRSLETAGRRGLVLGATSGDTGSAAIHACRGRENLDIVILYPEGRVTEFQRRQMTTVPDANVDVVAVRGDFDDCQRLVKALFASRSDLNPMAINSINFARIAAQAGYYVGLGARLGRPFDVVIPTGNFGNSYSVWMAKQLGVPINRITIANNANHGLADAVHGVEPERRVIPTLAPSMDIALPSNLERFFGDLATEFAAGWIDDAAIVDTIRQVHTDYDYLLDPHTATAWSVGESTRTEFLQVVVATAHPAKFSEATETAIGFDPGVPQGWAIDPDLPERLATIGPELAELEAFVSAG